MLVEISIQALAVTEQITQHYLIQQKYIQTVLAEFMLQSGTTLTELTGGIGLVVHSRLKVVVEFMDLIQHQHQHHTLCKRVQ
jgi:hypothetical protein